MPAQPCPPQVCHNAAQPDFERGPSAGTLACASVGTAVAAVSGTSAGSNVDVVTLQSPTGTSTGTSTGANVGVVFVVVCLAVLVVISIVVDVVPKVVVSVTVRFVVSVVVLVVIVGVVNIVVDIVLIVVASVAAMCAVSVVIKVVVDTKFGNTVRFPGQLRPVNSQHQIYFATDQPSIQSLSPVVQLYHKGVVGVPFGHPRFACLQHQVFLSTDHPFSQLENPAPQS